MSPLPNSKERIMVKKEKTKTFDCPECGNPLPCSDNRKIRCCWCRRLIVPRGFKNTSQKEAVIPVSVTEKKLTSV